MRILTPLILISLLATQTMAGISLNKEVYSWTDKVIITISAYAWNTSPYKIDSIGGDSEYPVKIGTRKNTLKPYRLVETSPDSGIFQGEVILTGFKHDANGDGRSDTSPRTGGQEPNNGTLETKRSDGLTVSWKYNSDRVLSKSARITWNKAQLRLDRETYSANDIAHLEAFEPDMNLNPETLDRLTLRVVSQTDVAGIQIYAIETGENSGVFTGEIQFSENRTSSGNRLRITRGDAIRVLYTDRTLPSPNTTRDAVKIGAEAVVR